MDRPLRRVVKLILDPHKPPVGILIRYEKLPEFCYKCGYFGHQLKECTLPGGDMDINMLKFPYGPWIRAEEDKVQLPVVNLLVNLSQMVTSMRDRIKETTMGKNLDIIGQKRRYLAEVEGGEADGALVVALDDNDLISVPIAKRRSIKPVTTCYRLNAYKS